MTNLSRPSTSCQIQRPSLTDDDDQGKQFLSKSLVMESGSPKQQQQQQPRVLKPIRGTPSILEQIPQQRLGRSLLSNDNWRQETMFDVRSNVKVIEQSDQNVLFGKGEI
jgi:hypothetical protein